MNIEQKHLDSVDNKLNQQHAVFASLGGAFWSIPAIVIWFWAYTYMPELGVMMFLLSGFLIGLAVRFHGKGMTRLFPLIALIAYTWVAIVAFSLEMVLHGSIWAMFLFGIYVTGAGVSMYLAKIGIPFEEHRAHTQLTSIQKHVSNKAKRNKWFIAIPILVLAISAASYLSALGLLVFKESQYLDQVVKQESERRQEQLDKEIDVTPAGLDARSTQEILRYSYAYYAGLLFDKTGRSTQPYPRSEYKAKTVLKYLVNSREDPRAMYILGLISEGDQGLALIKQAADRGDAYAEIHSLVKYGCNSNSAAAADLLNKKQKLAEAKHIRDEISSILYLGFPEICSDFVQPEYLPSYMINYKD